MPFMQLDVRQPRPGFAVAIADAPAAALLTGLGGWRMAFAALPLIHPPHLIEAMANQSFARRDGRTGLSSRRPASAATALSQKQPFPRGRPLQNGPARGPVAEFCGMVC